MVETLPPRTSTAVAPPERAALEARILANELPANVGRRASSAVTGFSTLVFGALTAGVAASWLGAGPSLGLSVLGGALFVCVLATMTAGFGFLTWRWARDLPPARGLAATTSERDALSD